MLVLAVYIVAEVPDDLKSLLGYKQEKMSFTVGDNCQWIPQDVQPSTKRLKKNSYIYHISLIALFIMIHWKSKATKGHRLLFFRDLILAFR